MKDANGTMMKRLVEGTMKMQDTAHHKEETDGTSTQHRFSKDRERTTVRGMSDPATTMSEIGMKDRERTTARGTGVTTDAARGTGTMDATRGGAEISKQ